MLASHCKHDIQPRSPPECTGNSQVRCLRRSVIVQQTQQFNSAFSDVRNDGSPVEALFTEYLDALDTRGMRYNGITRRLAFHFIIELEHAGAGEFKLHEAELACFDGL